jgi:tetratricopeptide (TPR) repeat protein
MAKKKPKRDGKGKPSGRPRPPVDLADLPDPRALEASLRQLTAGLGGMGVSSVGDEAQQLIDQAYQTSDPEQRVRLARQALEASPDCADAYVLLAENARSRKEALELYRKGVEAGERALGPEAFQEHAGHFWGLLETRPYMRARLGLAHSLRTTGRRDEAVGHLQDLLRLNPSDDQGNRYALAGYLLSLDRDDELAQLLDQYPEEGSAAWAYTRALLAFRREGDTIQARRLLKEARKRNKHVPPYLLGQQFPPAEQPRYYSAGDENEALEYIGSFLSGWKSTPGAIAWLRAHASPASKELPAPAPKGPVSFIKRSLHDRLPQQTDIWQADYRRLPGWVKVGAEAVRPWVILITDPEEDLVLGHHIGELQPSSALLWDKVVQTMQHPMMGEAHRPAELRVRPGEPWESLRPDFEEIGIRLSTTEALDQLSRAFDSLVRHVVGEPEPGLLDAPGVTPEQAGRFYDAAASFYQQAPWRWVGYESAINVECAKFHSGPWYAVLMGQSGLTMGLTLYESLDMLRQLWASTADDKENARQSVATTVTFGEATQTRIADLDAAERYGWKVAQPEAYPSVFHKERGLSLRLPLAWELELMEGCLRALPDFVRRRAQDDATREEATVPVASGELRLGLAWVVEEA